MLDRVSIGQVTLNDHTWLTKWWIEISADTFALVSWSIETMTMKWILTVALIRTIPTISVFGASHRCKENISSIWIHRIHRKKYTWWIISLIKIQYVNHTHKNKTLSRNIEYNMNYSTELESVQRTIKLGCLFSRWTMKSLLPMSAYRVHGSPTRKQALLLSTDRNRSAAIL